MKFSIIKITVFIHIFLLYSLHVAEAGDKDPTAELNEFNTSMTKIEDGIDRLQSEELTTFSSVELITSGDSDAAQQGYKDAIETIKTRIILEDIIQEEIQHASILHKNLANAYSAEWNEKMAVVANEFEAELSEAIDSLDKEVEKFSEVLDTERMDIFDHMARDKTTLLEAIKSQHINASQFETDFFVQLDQMTKLSRSVDKTQLLFFEFVVNCLDLQEERLEIEKVMVNMNMVNYLDVLQGQSIDAGNISTALDFTFAQFIKDSTPNIPAPPPVDHGFTVDIKPDRGVGGVYHAGTHDKIKFTIKATQDCWFILRYRDTMGDVKQLCPNERYNGGNFLKANIPLVIPDDLPYDFVAQKPFGIDSLEVIASPDQIEYLPETDKLAMGPYSGPSKFKNSLASRGINMQKGQSFESFLLGGSYDKVFYNPDAKGNAVIAKTFIRVVP